VAAAYREESIELLMVMIIHRLFLTFMDRV